MNQKDSTQSAVIRTLLYAQVFGCGVREQELQTLLLSHVVYSPRVLRMAIATLVAQKIIHQGGGWLWMNTRTGTRAYELRRKVSERKKEYLVSILPSIAWIPTLQGVAITGSVAVGNAKAHEDIDLLLVTTAGFLWLTRALVLGILFLRGVLRTRDMKNVRNKLCLNLWLDTSALALPKQSLYVARELMQSQWLINRGRVRERFFFENLWAAQFVAGGFVSTAMPTIVPTPMIWVVRMLAWPLERIALYAQQQYMRGRTREIVTPHAAFFHPRDTNYDVLSRYQKLCHHYKIDSHLT